jgi:hypothetical protein
VNAAIAEGWNTVGELKVLVLDNRHSVLIQQMHRNKAALESALRIAKGLIE